MNREPYAPTGRALLLAICWMIAMPLILLLMSWIAANGNQNNW